MIKSAPHVIPYQGSKRKLASDILNHIGFEIDTLYEPFAGSAAITLAMAVNGIAKKYVIADKLEALAALWDMIIDEPEALIEEYTTHWNDQMADPAEYYLKVRNTFNKTKSPAALLYLVARCVKNAVRFNSLGEFNQGADHRRLGLKPSKLMKEVHLASKLLKGRTSVVGADFREVLASATKNDLVYMDPPWQGTSGKKDPRYAFLLDINELTEELFSLNKRGVPFILSFDGTCGDRTYGNALPEELGLKQILLNAGRSSQATLLGRDDVTFESLYLSPALLSKQSKKSKIQNYKQMSIFEDAA